MSKSKIRKILRSLNGKKTKEDPRISEYRILAEAYLKRKRVYQFFDLNERKDKWYAVFYGINKDPTGNTEFIFITTYRIFDIKDIDNEIIKLKEKIING